MPVAGGPSKWHRHAMMDGRPSGALVVASMRYVRGGVMMFRAATFSPLEALSNMRARAAADDDYHGERRASATRGLVPESIVRGQPLSWIVIDDVPQ